MKNVLYLLSLISILFLSCTPTPETSSEPITIVLQPFSDCPKVFVDSVRHTLAKYYPHIKINPQIPLPKGAYTAPRNRYRADALINFLKSKAGANEVMIGLTTKDISTTKGTVDDYGIMGLGYQPGTACVISSFRISKTNTLEQFSKLALHELGHTQGLPHCAITFCFMRDAEAKNHLDEETRFCPNCHAHLTARNWY
jgi:archaemetzincin